MAKLWHKRHSKWWSLCPTLDVIISIIQWCKHCTRRLRIGHGRMHLPPSSPLLCCTRQVAARFRSVTTRFLQINQYLNLYTTCLPFPSSSHNIASQSNNFTTPHQETAFALRFQSRKHIGCQFHVLALILCLWLYFLFSTVRGFRRI